jgi:hypothetical protein
MVGVLAMLELEGETSELLEASEALNRLLPSPEGLLARIVAPTEDGMVLFQLWESAAARQRNADDPVHAQALVDSGIRARVRGSRSRIFDDAVLQHPAEGRAG